MTTVRIRGIYATALTRRLLDAGYEIVDASPAIERRFDVEFAEGPAAVDVDTTYDRQGLQVGGEPEAVDALRSALVGVGIDAFAWPDPAPVGAVSNAEVVDTGGGGATVDLPGGATGYLPFDAVDDYVDVGDRLRVQVTDPRPPWDDQDPRVEPSISADGGLVTLERGRGGVRADAGEADATALARTTDLLDVDWPDGWGVRWRRGAVDASHDAMAEALRRAAETAAEIDPALDDAADPEEAAPRSIATQSATAWVWFGRESRFALDDDRRAVTTTIPGHHRIKAAAEAASVGVDLAEALCDEPADEFPFDAVARQLGPVEGDRVAIRHGKPDGDRYSLGRGEVTEYDPDGKLTVRREIHSEGTYDAIGTPREPGDEAVTTFEEGRWWYPTAYRSADGERKGTYVNVCTPVELFPETVRYVDLYVDVVRTPGGEVRRVDEDELSEAVDEGYVREELAERAREVASTVASALE